MSIKDLSGRDAARARRNAQVYGKSALPAKGAASVSSPVVARSSAASSVAASTASKAAGASGSCRQASLARRRKMSSQGKAGIASADRQREATRQAAAADNAPSKGCGCGCNGEGKCKDSGAEMAKASTSFLATTLGKVPSSVRTRDLTVISPSSAGRINSRLRRQALATHGKTGEDIFSKGMSSVQMARQQNPDVSGRDIARSVRKQRSTGGGSQAAKRSAPAGRRRPHRPADDVTGTQVAHSAKTTGDETGLCRSVTGTDYLAGAVFSDFCQTEAPKVPRKVQTSELLRGGHITSASSVGRSEKVTGDERGTCKNVTGTEYLGREQFAQFCGTKPEPGLAKVSFSQTSRGQIVSGSKPARSEHVTGDEAGTCKAVTGTPYAGSEQFQQYCRPEQVELAEARSQRRAGNAGRDITGLQPGLSALTGAERGACKDVSGTAYIGAAQQQAVCSAAPAQVGEPDFPKPLAGAPWGDFSVVAPSHAKQGIAVDKGVTGTRYEQGRVSGTFSQGEGKVTGTEDARFGDSRRNVMPVASPAAVIDVAKVGRVTGEGLDIGLNITGNDWGRGDRVTGTEGTSAARRNPTRRGPSSAMPSTAPKRNEDIAMSDINVTGGSGNTDKGAMVTVSGGARG